MAGAGVLIAILAILLPTGGWSHVSTTQHSPNDDYYRLPVCRPGTHFNADNQTCSVCVEGLTYNEVYNRAASCKACRVCGENEEQMSQCTITRNARCYCHSDYYRSAEGVCIPRNATLVTGPGGTGRAFMRTAPWSAVSADPAQPMETDADRSRRSGAQATTVGALGSDSSAAASTEAANDPSGGGSHTDARSTVAPPLDGTAVGQHSTADPGAGGVSDDSRGQPIETSTPVTSNETTAASDGVSDDSSGQPAAGSTTTGAAAVVSDDPAGQPHASVGERGETTTGAGDDAGGQTAADNSPAVRQDEETSTPPAIEDPTSTDEGDGDATVAGDATEATPEPEEPSASTVAAAEPTDGGDGDDYTTESDPETSDESSTAAPPDDAASDQPDVPTEDVAAGVSDRTTSGSHTTGKAGGSAVGGGHDGSRGDHDAGGKDSHDDRGIMHEPARPWRIATGVLVGVLTVIIIIGIVFWMFPKTRGYTVNEQRPSVVQSGHYSQGDIEMTSQHALRSPPTNVVVV